jgi:hypothetical protein
MTENENTKKRSFTVEGSKYAVRVPTVQEIKEANEMRAKTFNDALSRGDLLRDQLESELRKRELWNDDREQEYQTLRREVLDGEYKLQKGGIKLNQAKGIALGMTDNRNQMVNLLSSRTDLDSNTCEGKADAARFNYLFACCLVYDETEEQYFPNKLDDYLLNQDDVVAAAGATEFYYLISGTDNVDTKLPENKFLQKFNFVDDKLQLIDKDGRLIDSDGKHIDTQGNFVRWNNDGTSVKVDTIGRPVNADGDFDIDHASFLDDGGKPIDESIYEKVEEEVAGEDQTEGEKPTKKKPAASRERKKKAATTKASATDDSESDN